MMVHPIPEQEQGGEQEKEDKLNISRRTNNSNAVAAPTNNKKRQKKDVLKKKIPVVIVESHNHCLEHYHEVLRRRKYLLRTNNKNNHEEMEQKKYKDHYQSSSLSSSLLSGWSLLHWDSHPDMACPNPTIPAVACYQPTKEISSTSALVVNGCTTSSTSSTSGTIRTHLLDKDAAPAYEKKNSTSRNDDVGEKKKTCQPTSTSSSTSSSMVVVMEQNVKKNLYVMLDSTATGIAEWILPMVLSANLNQVVWIRPSSSYIRSSSVMNTTTTTTSSSLSSSSSCTIIEPQQFPIGKHLFHVGAWIPPPAAAAAAVVLSTTAALQPSCPNIITTKEPYDDQKDPSIRIDSFLDLPNNAIVKVDWNCRYYQSDQSYVPTNELLFAQQIELQCRVAGTSEDDSLLFASSSSLSSSSSVQLVVDPLDKGGSSSSSSICVNPLYAVDICLDYFDCCNPYVTDLHAFDPYFTKALIELLQQSNFYNNNHSGIQKQRQHQHESEPATSSTTACCFDDYKELHSFQLQIAELLQQWVITAQTMDDSSIVISNNNNNKEIKQQSSWLMMNHPQLSRYYSSVHQFHVLMENLNKEFHSSSSNIEQKIKLVQLTIEALPYLDMPHFHVDDETNISIALNKIRQDLCTNLELMKGQEPWIISIARSTNDGFTTQSQIESLQQKTLHMIHDCYCTCPYFVPSLLPWSNEEQQQQLSCHEECRLMVLLDYGQWEGGTFTEWL